MNDPLLLSYAAPWHGADDLMCRVEGSLVCNAYGYLIPAAFLLLGYCLIDILTVKGYSGRTRLLLGIAVILSPIAAVLYLLASVTVLKQDPSLVPPSGRPKPGVLNILIHGATIAALSIVMAATFFAVMSFL